MNQWDIDTRTDIYSLGATFYHAITGRYPFYRDSIYSAVMSHVSDPLLPPHKLIDIPIEVSELIQKMMEKNPNDRFQTVEEILPFLISFFSESVSESEDKQEVKDSLDPLVSFPGTITTMLIRAASNSSKLLKKRLVDADENM